MEERAVSSFDTVQVIAFEKNSSWTQSLWNVPFQGVEEKYGSIWLLWVTAVSIVVTSSLYLFVTVAAATAFPEDCGWLWKAGLRGFSGVLFHWKVFKLQQRKKWNFKGFVDVDPDVYLLLLVTYLHLRSVENHVGWLGHLCGIAIGKLHWFGYMSWIMPSIEFASELEEKLKASILPSLQLFGRYGQPDNVLTAAPTSELRRSAPRDPPGSASPSYGQSDESVSRNQESSLESSESGEGDDADARLSPEQEREARLRRFGDREKVD